MVLARAGWIGTGVMGSSMCGHLITAGYGATVFNRTERCEIPHTCARVRVCSCVHAHTRMLA
ncbi:hypothetical protein EON67_11800 [archaeon]|nr:MAG: hypothetical protein EON67_11800 [archaeon]